MSSATTHEPPTVVTADDHPATRLGVRMALTRGGFRVTAEAADCDGAVEAVLAERPDVCLLDVRMPGGGIEAARRVKESGVKTSVVMLTVSQDSGDVLAALRAGAIGYLPKDTRPDRLPAALVGVLTGEAALPRALVPLVLRSLRGPGGALHRARPRARSRALREGVRGAPPAALGVEDGGDRRDALALTHNGAPPHLGRRLRSSASPTVTPPIRALGTTAVA